MPAGAQKAALPAELAPQLATLVDGPPRDVDNWIYEIKFDGYRLLARVEGTDIRLLTRNGHDWSARLPALHRALGALALPSGWYDGEVVVLNDRGVPDFSALQTAFDTVNRAETILFLFDLPFFRGFDLRGVALEARRALLQQTLESRPSLPLVRFSEVFDGAPADILASACRVGLEGVIAKRRGSRYVERRSGDWIKLKCVQRQEFVIGGYTDPKGSRQVLGSLLLGVYTEDGGLQYVGDVGTGFGEQTLATLQKALAPLAAAESPFVPGSAIPGRPHWVKPRLVAEVSFAEWTRGGRVRQGVFHGLRRDKKPQSIRRERPGVESPKG
jgi:bifunctional non-homologous end joining protein LigD